MKNIYRLISIAAAVLVMAGCVDKGGYVFGTLPPGVTPVEGEALQARNAVYNTDLSELTVYWRATADAKIYKGVEVSFTTLAGSQKTVKMYANKNFPSSFDRFCVLTVNPETVNYRCIWNNEDGEETMSEWACVDELPIRNVTSAEVFTGYRPPKFNLVTKEGVSAEAKKAYENIVGKDVPSQEAYYTDLFLKVLSTIFYNNTDYMAFDYGSRALTTLKCILGPMDLDGALAYVSGDADGPLMMLGSEIMESVASGSTSMEYAEFEIRGVLIHEFTHIFQMTVPYNSGDNPNYYACIEGFADAVRCACKGVFDSSRINTALKYQPYYDDSAERTENGKFGPYVWQIPYGGSGFFMQWLRYYDGDFLRKLSSTMVLMKENWSMEMAVKYILGDSYNIKTLWEEYVEDAKAENTSK